MFELFDCAHIDIDAQLKVLLVLSYQYPNDNSCLSYEATPSILEIFGKTKMRTNANVNVRIHQGNLCHDYYCLMYTYSHCIYSKSTGNSGDLQQSTGGTTLTKNVVDARPQLQKQRYFSSLCVDVMSVTKLAWFARKLAEDNLSDVEKYDYLSSDDEHKKNRTVLSGRHRFYSTR